MRGNNGAQQAALLVCERPLSRTTVRESALFERILMQAHLAFEVCAEIFLTSNWEDFDDGEYFALRIARVVG